MRTQVWDYIWVSLSEDRAGRAGGELMGPEKKVELLVIIQRSLDLAPQAMGHLHRRKDKIEFVFGAKTLDRIKEA